MIAKLIYRRYQRLILVISIGLFFSFWPLQPLFAQNNIKWYSMKEAQTLAEKQSKKVLIYAEASWCSYCRKMEKDVFPQQAVIDSLKIYYYPVKINIESNKTMVFNGQRLTEQQFARRYRIQGTPTTFFVDQLGEILGAQPGFIPADTFSRLLAYVGKDIFQNMKFKNYLQENTAER